MTKITEPEFIIEDYLVAMVTAAMAEGGVLGVQQNAVGKSAGTFGVQNVRRVCPPEENVFPAVGIEFTDYTNDVSGNHEDSLVMHYDLVVAVIQPGSMAQADTTESARLALRNYVNDGSGNGMSPLLRSDRTLGGNCTACWIESLQYRVYQGSSAAAGTVASAWYRFAAKALVKW